ncbi:MAG TPA: hypothetical protein VGR70_00305 [Stellaceae bacterium]|nr:hypothetical protein [Stellaceae bacterium]
MESGAELVGILYLRKAPILWVSRNPDGSAHLQRIQCALGPAQEWNSPDLTPEQWIAANPHKSLTVGPVGREKRVRGLSWVLSTRPGTANQLLMPSGSGPCVMLATVRKMNGASQMLFPPSLPRSVACRAFRAGNGELGVVPSDVAAFLDACQADHVEVPGRELWLADHE